jgi:thymidylate kinase
MKTIVSSTAPAQEKSSSASPEEATATSAVGVLIDALNRSGIRYCHWKSNMKLGEALRLDTDLDLLVARADAARFQCLIGSLGYKPGLRAASPSICHYYGLDREQGRLIHVHVYYRIITGGTLLKNYRLPLEEMLLCGAQQSSRVFVPGRAAEQVSFVVRKMLEYASPIEAMLLAREGTAVIEELNWLSEGVSESEISRLLDHHLPNVEFDLFRRCREAIASGSPLRRFLLARALASRLGSYARYRGLRAAPIRLRRLAARLLSRIAGRRVRDNLLSGGAVIAVVGPDGSGKSTVVTEILHWLGACLQVRSIHAGKPPRSVATLAPRAMLPLVRRLMPRYRTTVVQTSGDASAPGPRMLRARRLFFVYPLRAVMLAHERRRLLVRAHREAAGGGIVLSDRYPTRQTGSPEGPALSFLLHDANPLYRWLARLEAEFYRTIPPPNLVLHLEVPVDVACHRNLTRDKPGERKATDTIRRRHAQFEFHFPGAPVHRVSTGSDLEDTLRSVKEIVWREV